MSSLDFFFVQLTPILKTSFTRKLASPSPISFLWSNFRVKRGSRTTRLSFTAGY